MITITDYGEEFLFIRGFRDDLLPPGDLGGRPILSSFLVFK